MMDAVNLTDALIAAGVLVALGVIIALGGRARDSHSLVTGRLISLGGLAIAAVASGAWHGSGWGQIIGLVLLLIGVSTLRQPSEPETSP